MTEHSEHHHSPFPPSRPPRYAPESTDLEAHPELLKNCLFTYVFLWMQNGKSFWMYPTGSSVDKLSGYVWDGVRWKYAEFFWQQIDYFF